MQNHKTIQFTEEGYKKIEEKLATLLKTREEVVVRLRTAREMGDLSENGAYKYAKFELGNIARELRRLRQLIQNGVVVPKKATNGHIAFGSVVSMKSEKHTMTFTLVSEFESNPTKKKLSMKSPVGAAVLGKKVGDTVVIRTPSGEAMYQIISVA